CASRNWGRVEVEAKSRGGNREHQAKLEVRAVERRTSAILGGIRPRASRLGQSRTHDCKANSSEAVESPEDRTLRFSSGGVNRQSGGRDGPGGSQGDLPQRMAGRSRREPSGSDLSRPEPVSLKQRARPRQEDQSGASEGRPDSTRRRERRDR